MDPKIIDKIYWITHPLYGAAPGVSSKPVPFSVAERYIKEVLLPLVKRCQQDPAALFVFVPSSTADLHSNRDMDFDRVKRVNAIEEHFIDTVEKLLKKRLIVPRGVSKAQPAGISDAVIEKIKLNGFSLSPKVLTEARGTWWEVCAFEYPCNFVSKYTEEGKVIEVKAREEELKIGAKYYGKSLIKREKAIRQMRARRFWNVLRVPLAESMTLSNKHKPFGWRAKSIKKK
jgi:hypothetical protein